jgi:3,4-dihydroxy 2-butanone 4-phosphate synthase / GTP cyclohydrolase II
MRLRSGWVCYNHLIMGLQTSFADVPTAIEEIRAGRMIVVVDDEDRENEGDITLAAEKVTPEAINFMAKYGRGLVCLAMTEERLDHLRLGPMSAENTSQYGTAFCEAIDARAGVTTGISAFDRARTIQVAIDPATKATDLARPGHVFPLRARKGGVLVRAGQTEASVDLARLAGLIPAGIICEIMKDDGTMARVPDLMEFCGQHGMKMLTVAELIRYRMAHERYVHRVGEALVETRFGEFRLIAYESEVDGGESHVALIRGDVENSESAVLVRMHAHCLMGDVFGATGCECHATLEGSLRRIAQEGRGALIYLHQTSQGFSVEKVGERSGLTFHKGRKLPALLDNERQTQREIGIGAQILSDLNLRRIRLLTNRPKRVAALEGFGIEIVDQVPVELSGVRAGKS